MISAIPLAAVVSISSAWANAEPKVKLPKIWRENLELNQSPALAREVLTEKQIGDERVMLLSRLKNGIKESDFEEKKIDNLIKQNLVLVDSGKIILTVEGRLLADLVFRQLTD